MLSCHNDKLKAQVCRLNGVDVANLAAHADVWEKVVRKLNGRAMPPIGRPRPDEATYESLVTFLESSLDRIAVTNPAPGRTETFRRLTRTEYRNAIRDLLAVDVDVQSLLRPTTRFCFDTVTSALGPDYDGTLPVGEQKIRACNRALCASRDLCANIAVDLTQN